MSVVPASKTLAMLGWSIRARAWRSAPNRARTWRLSMPALMSLSATVRLHRLRLLGHVDRAHAPLADRLQQLVGADDRAGLIGIRTSQRRCVAVGSGRVDEAVGGWWASSRIITRRRSSAFSPQAWSR